MVALAVSAARPAEADARRDYLDGLLAFREGRLADLAELFVAAEQRLRRREERLPARAVRAQHGHQRLGVGDPLVGRVEPEMIEPVVVEAPAVREREQRLFVEEDEQCEEKDQRPDRHHQEHRALID